MARPENGPLEPDPYQLLSDRAHRAAYDQGGRVPEPGPRAPRPPAGTAVRVTVLSPSRPPTAPAPAEPGAVLWAGPVRVEPPGPPPGRYLNDGRERPW